jgi:dTDP-4-amino-4,6-dideoxygalactose transaminase
MAIQDTIKAGVLKPKAIIPVDLFGVPARYRLIDSIAKKYDLKVIEDAAQSFGASIGDRKVGTFGDIAATSFYPAKPLGCYGDGGAIFTNDDNLAEQCKAIRIHGTSSDKYNSEVIGLNGRLDSMQAAVLLEKLTIFDEELDMRNKVSDYYRKYLNNAQHIPDNYHSAHALFSITLGSHKKREELVDKLRKNNIPNVIYYKYPIHLMKGFHYLGYKDGDFPISENLSQTIVSLPMHPYLSEIEIDSIINTIKK